MDRYSRRALLERVGLSSTALLVVGLPAAVRAQAATKITFAAIPADIAAEAWYGVGSGIFKKHGLDGTVIPLPNGGAISAAVLGGSADIGYSNVMTLAQAHGRGLPVTLLAPANLNSAAAPTAGIVSVKRSSPYHSGKDLNGKIFAVIGLNNIAHVAARAWVDKTGGDSRTVKFVELPFPEMEAALIAERIDAGSLDAVFDPTIHEPNDPLRMIGSAFDAVSPNFAPSVWFTTDDWVIKHTDEAKAFVAAMAETAAWANTHHHETAALLAPVTRAPIEKIESALRVTYGERLTVDLIQPNIDVAAKYGLLKAFPATDFFAKLGSA